MYIYICIHIYICIDMMIAAQNRYDVRYNYEILNKPRTGAFPLCTKLPYFDVWSMSQQEPHVWRLVSRFHCPCGHRIIEIVCTLW